MTTRPRTNTILVMLCGAFPIATMLIMLLAPVTLAQNPDLPYSSGSTGADGPFAPGIAPSARYGPALTYDTARQRVVLFGGDGSPSGPGEFNDTREWDGTNWTLKTPVAAPAARYYHALAYDAVRQRVVLFGGFTANTVNDTWEWDGVNWAQKSPVTNPPPRYHSASAYDSVRQRTILFGGLNGNNGSILNDTWEWDGANWVQRAPATVPVARYAHALAFDAARQRVVLFGGAGTQNGSLKSDTWEWDGTDWTQKTPTISPPARYAHALAYDVGRQRVVLFGGQTVVAGGYLNETWEWDGINWEQKTTTTTLSVRSQHGLAYDTTRQRVVLFGGYNGNLLNDTWEWDGTVWTFRSGNPYLVDMTGRANGVWNYTSITVPAGVTVNFIKNAANSPVTWLATENVQIAG